MRLPVLEDRVVRLGHLVVAGEHLRAADGDLAGDLVLVVGLMPWDSSVVAAVGSSAAAGTFVSRVSGSTSFISMSGSGWPMQPAPFRTP